MLHSLSILIVAGSLGVVVRWWTQTHTPMTYVPLGLLLVNVLGSLVVGMVGAWIHRGQISWTLQLALAVGFCGGLTTFSGYIWDCLQFMQQGEWVRAACNMFVNNGFCLLSCWLGWKFLATWVMP